MSPALTELEKTEAARIKLLMLNTVLKHRLSEIDELSRTWKHGNEGVHLLRINDLAKD